MKVKIVATRACNHRPNLGRELQQLGVSYELLFVEENPEEVSRYVIRQSPTLIVDDQVAFHGQPTERELRDIFERYGLRSPQ